MVDVAPFATAREKRATLALALPCLALYTLLAMRAVIPAVHALGFPWLYFRARGNEEGYEQLGWFCVDWSAESEGATPSLVMARDLRAAEQAA